MKASKYIIIDSKDNVMISLDNYNKGDIMNGITLLEDIKIGHKVALLDIKREENIIKYGTPIGRAIEDIKKGSWVHVHNTKTNLSDKMEFEFNQNEFPTEYVKPRMVNVYKRKNGEVGIRNELWVIPTVGCVSSQAKKIVSIFNENHKDDLLIDGCFTFTHPYGCSQMGEDQVVTLKSLANLIKHPNAGAVLVLGLGCENCQISKIKDELKEWDDERVKFLLSQDVTDEIAEGVKILESLYEVIKNDKRTPEPLSSIRVGLECGGSDGLSGITANPLIGLFSDYIVKNGGTTVLTEIPEMFGAENFILSQSDSKETFDKLLSLINEFKDYYKKHDQVIYENPSPGNKNGGITTLEDKSNGCVRKSGHYPIKDVLKMTDRIKTNGVNIISSPGNDLVATTILGLSGCQLVLFSTGRGTPFGGFIPTMKISTNSYLYEKKPSWIDFNAGIINQENEKEVLDSFINSVISIIEGKKTKNEINEFREIAIFKDGVTL